MTTEKIRVNASSVIKKRRGDERDGQQLASQDARRSSIRGAKCAHFGCATRTFMWRRRCIGQPRLFWRRGACRTLSRRHSTPSGLPSTDGQRGMPSTADARFMSGARRRPFAPDARNISAGRSRPSHRVISLFGANRPRVSAQRGEGRAHPRGRRPPRRWFLNGSPARCPPAGFVRSFGVSPMGAAVALAGRRRLVWCPSRTGNTHNWMISRKLYKRFRSRFSWPVVYMRAM